MAPIRVGIIGLSKNAKTSWASKAHLPYLLASNGKYEIKALCNSSVDSAKEAIKVYKLPPSTKAYGDPHDIANDPELDLIVNSTRVDVHYSTIKPSIEAGRNVLVEWPLTSSTAQSHELATLAAQKGVRTVVCLQGRLSPPFLKIKELIESGMIGKVLSSFATAAGGTNSVDSVPESLKYFLDRKVGGNMLVINLGHMIDSMLNVLGPMEDMKPKLSLQRPVNKVLSSTGETLGSVKSDVPDLVDIQGALKEHAGAPISVMLRRGQPFKDTPGFVWSIMGENAEIRMEADAPATAVWDTGAKIMVQATGTQDVENIEWKSPMAERGLQGPPKNIGNLYEAYADGTGGWPDFQQAVERHKMLDEVYGDWSA